MKYAAGSLTLAGIALVHAASAQNQILGAGYTTPPALSASVGQLVTLFVPALNVPDATASQVPLPTSLSGVSVAVRVPGVLDSTGYPTALPILRVRTVPCEQGAPYPYYTAPCGNLSLTQITAQIPAEKVCVGYPGEKCNGLPDTPSVLVLNVRANGVTGPDVPLGVGLWVRFLSSCDTIFGSSGPCYPLVTHPDGSMVNNNNPARVGETTTIYATGLSPSATGYPEPMSFQLPDSLGRFTFGYRVDLPTADGSTLGGFVTQSAQAAYVGAVGGYIGLQQYNFKIPPMPAQAHQCVGTSDVNASLTPPDTSPALYICVRP